MSEEKLYMVQNDKGKYWGFDYPGFWRREIIGCYATTIKEQAEIVADEEGGHVVALIEEPEKVVLPRKAAEWIDSVKDGGYDITYIFTEYAMPNEVSDWLEDSDDDAEHREERGLMLINAYLYGYTVAKEKKYNVKVPYAEGWHFQKYSSDSKLGARNNWKPFPSKDIDFNMGEELFQFTESEIEHYGLQDCEKVEIIDDSKTAQTGNTRA